MQDSTITLLRLWLVLLIETKLTQLQATISEVNPCFIQQEDYVKRQEIFRQLMMESFQHKSSQEASVSNSQFWTEGISAGESLSLDLILHLTTCQSWSFRARIRPICLLSLLPGVGWDTNGVPFKQRTLQVGRVVGLSFRLWHGLGLGEKPYGIVLLC